MKLLMPAVVMACAFTDFLPQAICQDDKKRSEQKQTTERLHLLVGRVSLSAMSIQREDPPTPRPSVYASVVRLKGNVEIRTCCVVKPGWTGEARRQYMVMRADEADYDAETGEIEARGSVRVKFEAAK